MFKSLASMWHLTLRTTPFLKLSPLALLEPFFWFSSCLSGHTDRSQNFFKLQCILAWWESYYIVFIVLISLRTSENFTGQHGRGDRLGCRWAFGSLWPGRTLKFLPLSLCVSPAPLLTSLFLSSYLQTHTGTFQSSREKHAVYQNWIDPHLWLKVADTWLKSSRGWDAREGWQWLCRDKNHAGQQPGGDGGCRELGPENLSTCQSSFIIGKENRKRSIMEDSRQTGCVSEI